MKLVMSNYEWQITIEEDIRKLRVEVYAYRLQSNEETVEYMNSEGEVKEVERGAVVSGDEIEPLFVIPQRIFHGVLLPAISDRFKPSDQSKVEGKLKATEKHLEDMRELVFGKKDNQQNHE